MTCKEQIIVLKNQVFLESDLIIRGLTKQGCQMSFIAKGALKSKKRFIGGVLEPSSYIELEYRPSKKSLQPIQSAWFIEDFSKLRTNWHRLNLALYFLNIVCKISQEGEQDSRELFDLLGNALKQAETSSDLDSLKIFFQIKILFLQGVLEKELYLEQILNKTIKDHSQLKLIAVEKSALLNKLDRSLKHYLER